MRLRFKRLIIAIAVVFLTTSHSFSKTIVLCRSEDQSERLMIDVPDKWPVTLEPFGTDFIIHNMVATSTGGDENLRLGWLADPEAPQRISDDMVDSFKSQMDYWLTSHQMTGKITSVQELTIGNREARLFQLEMTQSGAKLEIDYYMILGENSVYIISVGHTANADLTEMDAAIKSICVKSEVFARLLPPPAEDPDQPPPVTPVHISHSDDFPVGTSPGSSPSSTPSSTFADVVLPSSEDNQIMFVIKVGMIIVALGGGALFIVAGFMRSTH